MEGKKLAIIGASYLQEPLVLKARELGIETHVFAWENGAVAKDKADFFYPISIIDKEEILIECQRIGIDGITSVASDVAVETVNYVAELMGLVGNSRDCSIKSRDKFEMRRSLSSVGLNVINYQIIDSLDDSIELDFPFMVKAVDRSGSRGVSLVNNLSEDKKAEQKKLKMTLRILKSLQSKIKEQITDLIVNTIKFNITLYSPEKSNYSLQIAGAYFDVLDKPGKVMGGFGTGYENFKSDFSLPTE